MCSFSTYFKHILILHNSQLATTNWVKGRRMQLTNDKTCCATTLRQMLRCAQTTNVVCVARLSDMLNDPYCPSCVCSTRMACPEILGAPRINGAGENTWHIYNASAQDAPLVHTPAEHAYWNMTAWARFCEYTLSRWNETINYVCKHKSPRTWPPPNMNMRLREKSCAHILRDLYACTCST